jgi:antagonist of KipI
VSLVVLKPGSLTSVQDLGRLGYQRHGVEVGGAVDRFALRVANSIVGNPESAAGLEVTQHGPELRAERDLLVAWCGAEFDATVAGEALPRDRAVRVAAGETIQLGAARRGLRAWLAVAGGIDVPRVLGSRSTALRAGFGGHCGRPLQAGDRLPIGDESTWAQQRLASGRRGSAWSVQPDTLGRQAAGDRVRAVRGPEWEWFHRDAQGAFFSADWRVTKDVDRMGVRLEGPALTLAAPREMISEGVNEGVVQVPAGGQPIVLLASRQTVGGYPRIGAVTAVDWSRLAQLRPGSTVRFEEVSLAEAHELYLARERDLARVRAALARLAG